MHLSERARVALVMRAGKIKPVWFEQSDNPSRVRIMTKDICYTWKYMDGAAKILCYAVSDGVLTPWS
jgi:hypothetical protein